jgi:polyhydroxybutyrate depolymerase
VFAVGFSNGGKMAYTTACRAADKLVAITISGSGLGISSCTPSLPVSIQHFHGTADQFYPFNGGTVIVQGKPVKQASAPDTIATWVRIDHCTTREVIVFRHGTVECIAHPDCADGVELRLCTIEGMGHQWPGAPAVAPSVFGPGSTDVSASDKAIAFFESHRNDRRAAP